MFCIQCWVLPTWTTSLTTAPRTGPYASQNYVFSEIPFLLCRSVLILSLSLLPPMTVGSMERVQTPANGVVFLVPLTLREPRIPASRYASDTSSFKARHNGSSDATRAADFLHYGGNCILSPPMNGSGDSLYICDDGFHSFVEIIGFQRLSSGNCPASLA